MVAIGLLLPPQSLDHSLEGILPSVHLDHSDSHNHLIHDTHTFVRDPGCLESAIQSNTYDDL